MNEQVNRKKSLYISRMKKMFSSFMIVAIVLSAYSSYFLISQRTTVQAETASPRFMVEAGVIPTGRASSNVSFTLQMKNIGDARATDALVSISIPDSSPFESMSLVNSKLYTIFNPGVVQSLDLTYRIKSSAKPGAYPLQVNFTYKDTTGAQKESSETIYIRVIDTTDPISIQIASVRTVPAAVVIGQSFDMYIEVINKSIQQINYVDVAIDGLSASTISTFDPVKKSTGTIQASEKKTVIFRMNASDKLEYGSYPINVKYSYMDPAIGLKEETQQIYIQTLRETYASIKINNLVAPISSIPAGVPFDISFEVENSMLRSLENVSVSVDGGDKIIPISSSIEKMESLNMSAKKYVKFTMKPLARIEPRPYVITLEVKYLKRGSSTEFESYKQTVTVDIAKSSELVTSKLSIPYSIREEQEFELSFDLTNVGKGDTNNVKSILELSKGILAITPPQVTTLVLKSQEVKRITYKLRTTKITEEGIYPIVIKLSSDDSVEAQTLNYGIYVQKAENSKMIPRLILDGYTLSAPSIQAGSNFDVNLNIKNTSIVKAVGNVKVTISSEEVNDKNVILGSVFVPVKSSSTFYIGKLGANQAISKTLNYRVLPNAESKNYFMVLNMEYEDENGTAYTVKENITIPVEQKAKFFITDVFIPADVMVNNESSFTVKFFNTGKVPLSNFKVQAQGQFTINSLPYFSINLAPGTDDTYDFTVIPSVVGEQSGTLVISYEETNGEVREITKDFTFSATESQEIDIPVIDPEQETSGFKWFSKMNIVIAVAIGLAGITAYRIRARFKKKADLYE